MKKVRSLLIVLLPVMLLFLSCSKGSSNKKQDFTVKDVNFTMVWCPPGEFMMGSDEFEEERDDYEKQHKVILTKGFWMLETEVTQELYNAITGSNPSEFKGLKNPVEKVSWNDAAEFCNMLSEAAGLTPYYNIKTRDTWSGKSKTVTFNKEGDGFRLPTEAEWEYAARAGTTTPFHYGKKLSSKMANFNGGDPYGGAGKGPYREKPIEVKKFKPNSWGLYDMHGNVSEWVWDIHKKFTDEDATDPIGPAGNSGQRVRRGGAWHNTGKGCRSAYRGFEWQGVAEQTTGFRFALTDKSESVNESEESAK